MSRVDDIDLTKTLSKDVSEKRVKRAQHRLTQLRLLTAGLLRQDVSGPGLIVVFEGFDSAGKGGAIRRLTASIDPRQVRVVPIGPPTEEELRHHFLWRFQEFLPGTSEMTVFDRSWYGRLLVERAEALIDDDTVQRSAREIVEFERMLLNADVTIVKFWLHISDEEQLRRFNDRANDPLKHWKLTPDDWRNREKRDQYLKALNFMVDATDHRHAHWDLIAAEDKHFARVMILETLIDRWVHDLERRGIEVPKAVDKNFLR
ncbi:MAG TPA: UDP-galactose-lipid carrier transferase [Acidimicrobiales bacterium]|nr:UDP-galactose-lipid carrier transferase [Acidimicrobiales bacterium]